MKISDVTEQTLFDGLIQTEFLNCYHKKHENFKPTINVSVANNEELSIFANICEEFLRKKSNNFNAVTKNDYIKFKVHPEMKVYDDKKKEIPRFNLEEICKNNELRLIFKVNKYEFQKKDGLTLKVIQCQIRPKKHEVMSCMFD